RTLPRRWDSALPLLNHGLASRIYAGDQSIPGAPVDAAIGVERGAVRLTASESSAPLRAPFGEILVGLAGLAARLATLWSVGVYSVRPEKRLPPARIGVPPLAQFDETIPQ